MDVEVRKPMSSISTQKPQIPSFSFFPPHKLTLISIFSAHSCLIQPCKMRQAASPPSTFLFTFLSSSTSMPSLSGWFLIPEYSLIRFAIAMCMFFTSSFHEAHSGLTKKHTKPSRRMQSRPSMPVLSSSLLLYWSLRWISIYFLWMYSSPHFFTIPTTEICWLNPAHTCLYATSLNISAQHMRSLRFLFLLFCFPEPKFAPFWSIFSAHFHYWLCMHVCMYACMHMICIIYAYPVIKDSRIVFFWSIITQIISCIYTWRTSLYVCIYIHTYTCIHVYKIFSFSENLFSEFHGMLQAMLMYVCMYPYMDHNIA